MKPDQYTAAMPHYVSGERAPETTVAQLMGQVYEAVPAAERCRILEHLMKPLGALSLVAVANGAFAKLWFRSGWHDLHIQPEDAQLVKAGDVVSLMDYVQQASVECVDGLAGLISASPVMACSAAAATLMTILLKRAKRRRADVDVPNGESSDSLRI